MARIRTLKPEILEDEKTAALSDSAFRLFASLILLADDLGNVRADGRWLKGQIWWANEGIESKHCVHFLMELCKVRLIATYNVNGQVYAHIVNWHKHQRLDNAGKPRVPPPLPDSLKFAEDCGESPRNAALPPTSDLGARREQVRGERANRKTPIPADWKPTGEHAEIAGKRGLDLALQAQKFRLHAEANDRRQVRWNAAFSQWLLSSYQDRSRAEQAPLRLKAPAEDELPPGCEP